jgi:cobaltochelatase CobS
MNATDALANLGSTLEELDSRLSNVETGVKEAHEEITASNATSATHSTLTVTGPTSTNVVEGYTHEKLQDVIDLTDAGHSPMLVGASGSGKTTITKQVATALGLKYYYTGAILEASVLLGYNGPDGSLAVRTLLREAWEHGGLFAFDEVDDSAPEALIPFNAMLGGMDEASFPDGMIKRHADFHAIASGNTYGKGADRIYVGRTQLDGAFTDRFAVVDIDYDEALETNLAPNDVWTKQVQNWRHSMDELGIRHIISPRASIAGGDMIDRGKERAQAAEWFVWKGLDPQQVDKIKAHSSARAMRAA